NTGVNERLGTVAALLLVLMLSACGSATQKQAASTGKGSTSPQGAASATPPGSSVATTQASTSPRNPLPAGPPKPRRIAPAHPVPAAFRPAPGAPSDAEIREELAQMAAI